MDEVQIGNGIWLAEYGNGLILYRGVKDRAHHIADVDLDRAKLLCQFLLQWLAENDKEPVS